LPRPSRDSATAFVAALLVTCILIFSMTPNTITNVSAVEANEVGVYWDSGCTDADEVSYIDWGTLIPGSVKSIPVYIRNEGQEPMYLILSTEDWEPLNASDRITLEWDYKEQRMNPWEDPLQITLTLSVSRDIEGISSFNFEIHITGSDRFPGDVNGDGRVNVIDLIIIGNALWSKLGDPNYDPYADLNGDGIVGATDIIVLGKYLFKTSL